MRMIVCYCARPPNGSSSRNRACEKEGTRVAVDGEGTVTGFATHLISDGVAELEDLFVDPARMRQGIATALVLDISSRLHQLGFESLEVTANPMNGFLRTLGVRIQPDCRYSGLSGSSDESTY